MRKKLIKNKEEISSILKILSHPDKLTILWFIDKDKKDVSSIVKELKIPQSTVSNHLRYLKTNKILESERKARNVYYRIIDKRIFEFMKELKKIFL